jgi:hypothetical protein
MAVRMVRRPVMLETLSVSCMPFLLALLGLLPAVLVLRNLERKVVPVRAALSRRH